MRRLLFLLPLAILPLLSCDSPSPPGPRNVILISMDTTRVDHLGCYGYGPPTSPVLDAFVEDGATLFTNSYSTSPWTLPAHASLMTGMVPRTHGAVFLGRPEDGAEKEEDLFADDDVSNAEPIALIGRLNDSVETLAEKLGDAGYRTGGFVSAPLLRREFGMSQGFEAYDDDLDAEEGSTIEKRLGGQTVKRAIDWMRAHRGEPKFLFVHFFDPHQPYRVPEAYKASISSPLSAYDLGIRYMTDQIGELFSSLEDLGERESSIIVITSDHGESFGEVHPDGPEKGHATTLYGEVVRNVLAIRFPKDIVAQQTPRIDAPVQLTDVPATICDGLGLEPVAGDQGTSLKPWIEGEEPTERPVLLYLGLNRAAPLQGTRYAQRLDGLVHGPWKYIRSSREGGELLFQLQQDPLETSNRLFHEHAEAKRMRERLDSLLGALPEPPTPDGPHLNPELRRSLEALGYVK